MANEGKLRAIILRGSVFSGRILAAPVWLQGLRFGIFPKCGSVVVLARLIFADAVGRLRRPTGGCAACGVDLGGPGGKLSNFGGYFNFKADCQQVQMSFSFFLYLLYFFFTIAPQGDTLQQGTEVSGCVVLPMSLQACRGSVWICTAVCPHVK